MEMWKKVVCYIMERRRHMIMLIILAIILIFALRNHINARIGPEVRYEVLQDPSYNDAVTFMLQDNTSENKYKPSSYTCYHFAVDTVYNAREKGIRCAYVVIECPDGYDCGEFMKHAVVGFNTTELGMVYFEPQTDARVFPKGVYYVQWENGDIRQS